MRMLFVISVVTALLATSCATDSDAPHLYAGMSRDRLKARFGEPLRVEHTPGGGENWYYSFSSPLELQGSTYHDEQSRSDSVSVTISESTGTQQRPVHLSPDGYVIEPLPTGHLVK